MESKPQWAFPGPEPKLTTKEDFTGYLHQVLKKGEVSWVVTDKRSFEWDEINLDRSEFFQVLSRERFSRAFVGVFYPSSGKMEYSSFRF